MPKRKKRRIKTAYRIQYEKDEAEWKKKILSTSRECIRCGAANSLQCAHIFSRGIASVRWDPNNGVVLCRACHIFWQPNHPIEFTIMVRNYRGNRVINNLFKKAYPNSLLLSKQK